MKIPHQSLIISIITLALVIPFSNAYDPSPLQDFCVAVGNPKNGGMNE